MFITVTILEENFDVEYDFDITSHGSPGVSPSLNYPGDPPEAPEFDLEILAIYKPKNKEPLEIPSWLKDLLLEYLYNSDLVLEAVYEATQDRHGDCEE